MRGGEITCCQVQNRPGKNYLNILPIKTGWWEKNIRTKTLSLILPFSHRLSLTPSFSTPLSPPCCEWHRRMGNGLLISPCELHSAAASSSQFSLNQCLVSAWSAAFPEQILCGASGWVAVPQDKPFSALVLPRLQFLQDMATCSGMEPSTSCRVDNCSIPVPSMGCRGNFCCGAWSAFPPSSLTSVLQDYLSHFYFPHSALYRILLSQPLCLHSWALSCVQADFTLNHLRGSKTQRNKVRQIILQFCFN